MPDDPIQDNQPPPPEQVNPPAAGSVPPTSLPHKLWLWVIYGFLGVGLVGLIVLIIAAQNHQHATPQVTTPPPQITASTQTAPVSSSAPVAVPILTAAPIVTPSTTFSHGQNDLGVNVIVNHDGTLVRTTWKAPKGTLINCALENIDTVSHTLTLSNGETVTAAAGQTARMPNFTLVGTVTYTVSGYNYTGSITAD